MNRFLLAASACIAFATATLAGPRIERTSFGKLPDGAEVDLYTLTNDSGMTAKITNYGAILTSLEVPGKDGKPVDVVLGFDKLADYAKGHPFFGATVGRYANRIGNAKFTLDGKEYKLAANNNGHSLHGGKRGFDKVVWKATPKVVKDGAKVTFQYVSKDMEEGYPGTLNVTVEYMLTKDNKLAIDYTAYCDKACPVNLTHHSYFNLNGHNSGTVLEHALMVIADRYTPTDKDLIPTGKFDAVKGTALDFTSAKKIGKDLNTSGLAGGGYDHNFVLNAAAGNTPEKAAVAKGDKSGITMTILTTEPGLQFYTGNGLGSEVGKGGAKYPQYGAFCLEAQHYPDSPNKPEFPTTILKPGQVYKQKTVHAFEAK